MQSEKTKALLRSINTLKKQIEKIKYEQKDNVRHKMNERLQDDIKLQEVAINALRKVIGDEDKCNLNIKKELQKGPARIRVLSREELKIEIKKYKNISLKIIKDYVRTGNKVPGYAKKLQDEADGDNIGEGLKVASATESNIDGDSMFEQKSVMMLDEEELPEKIQKKINKFEDQIIILNKTLLDKNTKILDLLSECEDVKI